MCWGIRQANFRSTSEEHLGQWKEVMTDGTYS